MSKLKEAPMRDIIAESFTAVDEIRKVAMKSGNLKGVYKVGVLNKAFVTLKTALTTISTRRDKEITPKTVVSEERSSIEVSLEEVREENRRLHEKIMELQNRLDEGERWRGDGRERSIPLHPQV